MIPPQPKEDNFLSDPDNLHYKIICLECHQPLWEMKILKRSGLRVMSTETKACDIKVGKFNRKIEWCPLCGKRFYGRGKKDSQMYLIQDLNSGITRMI